MTNSHTAARPCSVFYSMSARCNFLTLPYRGKIRRGKLTKISTIDGIFPRRNFSPTVIYTSPSTKAAVDLTTKKYLDCHAQKWGVPTGGIYPKHVFGHILT